MWSKKNDLRRTGPEYAKGARTAREDIFKYGYDFAVAFADAMSDFPEWFLNGYQDVVKAH